MTRIAIVDDDPEFLGLMCDALALEGYQTITLSGSRGSFEVLRDQPVDLIVVDIRMEQPTSGWQLLDRLRSDVRTEDIPILVCSAACDDLQAHEAWLGAQRIASLDKPFDIDDLYRAVRRTLTNQRHLRDGVVTPSDAGAARDASSRTV
jgi:CheY-like chemotaxis protein